MAQHEEQITAETAAALAAIERQITHELLTERDHPVDDALLAERRSAAMDAYSQALRIIARVRINVIQGLTPDGAKKE